jgi:DNA adenine methylase
MNRIIENYPGNKSVMGLFHLIINNMPSHRFYYELCAGSAEIARRKAPAERTIVNDIDTDVYRKLLTYCVGNPALRWSPMNENCLNMLDVLTDVKTMTHEIFTYIDPPYLDVTPIYAQGHDYEFHQKLIAACSAVKINCMISHYEHPLYDNLVTNCGWRKKIFKTWYHRKHVTEAIYMNYPEPKELHDYSLLGTDRTDRQRIKRKIERHVKRLKALSVLERKAILNALLGSV